MRNNAATQPVWRLVPVMALLVALALILPGPLSALARSGPADLRADPLASIYFSPSPVQVDVGAATHVDVWVDNVQGLYAVELRIAFPNSLVQVIDADATEPGVQIQRGDLFDEFDTYLIQNRAENTAGLIEYIISITGSQVGKSGSGIIATIPLQGIVGGDAVMSFVEVVLAERDGTSIPYTFVSNQVDIIIPMPATETPTPTATMTPSLTPSPTATATEPAISPTPSETPTFTPTFTPGPSPTLTHTATATFTPTFTPTSTHTPDPLPGPMTEVHVVPVTQTMGIGDLAVVQVAVQHAADLYGLDVRLDFNGALLDVEDAEPMLAGIQVWNGDVFEGLDHQVFTNWVYDDGVFGQVHFAATLNASNPAGVYGDAILFWITFRGAMPGTSALTLAEVELVDRTGTTMPRSLHHGSVTVTTDGEPATPTPSPTLSETPTPTSSATLTPTSSPTPGTPTSSPTPGTPTSTPSITPTGTEPTVPVTETPTPTETGALATPTPVCSDRIVNGGFETLVGNEALPWVRGGSVTYTTIEQHSGARSVWLGGYNNADDQVYQEVTIPDHALPGEETTQALLSYWWGVLTNDPSPATDYLYVRVRNTAGELLETLETLSNASITGRWQQSEHDLSAYKGQTIRITFEAITDASQATSFFVDDVTLIVCEILMPTPTPTATSTQTPSPTATETGLPTATPTATPIPVELVVQEGDGAEGRVRDSYLDEWNPTTNYGSSGAMSIRTDAARRPIIAFDLSEIPTDATVLSAMMELRTSHYKSHPQDMTVSAYGVKRAWRELETTWNAARTDVAWGQPGIEDTVSDRDAVPTASQLVSDTNTWYAFDITSLAQAWVSGARPNEGVVLLATGNTVELSFWSSQYGANETLRPRLVISYIHGPLPSPTETPTPTSTPDGLPTATSTATPEEEPTATPTEEGLPTATPTATPVPVEMVLQQADGAPEIVRDSYLNQWEPKTNYGHQGAMSFRTGGVKRPIIAFDLASVPDGATVLDARLELYTSHYKSHSQDMTVSVYGVKRAWREMETTWNVARTDVSWGQPGADDTVADRDATPADSKLVSTTSTWYSFDITALAQAWVSGMWPNEGVVLEATGNTVEMSFWASEYSVPNLRPRLVLRYILGELPPTTPTPTATPGNGPTPTPTLTPAPGGIRVTLQEGEMGYTGTQDTHISQWQPTNNYGGNVTMLARQGYVRSMLVRFDVSSIPAGATIQQATLSLYALSRSNAGNLTVDLYEVKRPWAEGQATWNLARTGQPWALPGCGQPESDLAATPASSQFVNAVDTWFNWEVTDLVQLWVANPASNQGMILKGDGPTSVEYSFASSEYWWSQHYAPTLTIRYTN
jgi:hypothetical protein